MRAGVIRSVTLVATLMVISGPALAQSPPITDADVRAFLARQEQAWNQGDLDRFFAAFTPDARFTDQAYVGDKPPVVYGVSTLAEARAQARRTKARSLERGEVRRIDIAADGRIARITSRVGSTVTADGRTRRLCASRAQTLTLINGRLRSTGQTDTYVNCRGG
ncbi:nuclear transport factor 2 family protein [Phenylobacterium sp.]|jgi:uncharacterized protein (TIGR02246 family)|uniref:nuclear transport factor 2 family protein n=1 Tax=Phenylobacterium sp. TaxID=1871053 RepID=UPI0037C69227